MRSDQANASRPVTDAQSEQSRKGIAALSELASLSADRGACPADTTLQQKAAIKRERISQKRRLPRLADLPMPMTIDMEAGGWGEQMREMADHIGPRATLLIVEEFGGRDVYIPAELELNPFLDIIGEARSRIVSKVYRIQRLAIPVGKTALLHARRAGVLAAVRVGLLSVADAAIIIGTSRTFVSHLVNHTNEGVGCDPIELIEPRIVRLLEAAAGIATDALEEAGVAAKILSSVQAEIIDLAS